MISYDPAKRDINLRKHGLDLTIAAAVLAGPTISREDRSQDYGELRLQTLGLWQGVVVFVVHTPRDGSDHIISVRKAEKHERRIFWENCPDA